MTYSEKLKDPRWQKKRLEILERDGWKCTVCGADKHQLHVHHKKYSGDPWQSPKKDLITVCCHCHEIISSDEKFKDAVNSGKTKSGKYFDDGTFEIAAIVFPDWVILRQINNYHNPYRKTEFIFGIEAIETILEMLRGLK